MKFHSILQGGIEANSEPGEELVEHMNIHFFMELKIDYLDGSMEYHLEQTYEVSMYVGECTTRLADPDGQHTCVVFGLRSIHSRPLGIPLGW